MPCKSQNKGRSMNAERRKRIQEIEERISALVAEAEALRDEVDEVACEEQDYRDAMPDSIGGSEKGQKAEAAIEALERGEPSMLKMRQEYELRRNYITSSLNEMGLECFKPRGAFYVFPKIASLGVSSKDFSLRLLREKKVAVVPGTAFGAGGEGFVRCSYATALDQIKIAMTRIGEFCEEVKSGRAAAA